MGRATLAVITGFVVWTAIWLGSNAALRAISPAAYAEDGSTNDAAMLMGILGVAVLACVVSGYLTASIAKGRSVASAVALGGVLLGVGVMVQMQYWNVMPLWYHITFLTALLPLTLVGGLLAGKRSDPS